MNKEKSSSFWKKFGLKRNKRSISSLKSEPNLLLKVDTTDKSKRLSGLILQVGEHTPKSSRPSSIQKLDICETPATPPITTSTIIVEDQASNDEKQELLSIISDLKSELEKQDSIIQVLQKQKQAVAKDLDYFEVSLDELLAEKINLMEMLDQEKSKNQQHEDDLRLVLEKMKSTADNARDQSFIFEQTKLELEDFQLKTKKENETLLGEIKQKDKLIKDLKYKLSKSQEETKDLKDKIQQLEKTHAKELSHLTEEYEMKLSLNTPRESPCMMSESEKEEIEIITKPVKVGKKAKTTSIPVPNTIKKYENRSPKQSMESFSDDLDDQLLKLTKEKEKLQSSYSKIPLTGGGPTSRKRREDLEAMLDQVDSQLSKVKQKIKRS